MHTKIGGQPGSKNALGNSGGGSGKKSNAVSHGFFSKYLPEETLSIEEIQGCF
ncbi:YjcR family HTH domain-containing protein [Bacillus velezensis]|nr:YjcR family HTH domain-containing protein [Bacillus velezensis]